MPKKTSIAIFDIAKTQVNREAVRRWLDHLEVSPEYELPDPGVVSDPALLIALAGKRCYRSFEVNEATNPNVTKIRADWGAYLDNILASAHGSVLEHSVYTWALEGVTRVLTAELNRHRAGWAISEGSLRYVRYHKELPYWEPDLVKGPDVYSESGLESELEWVDQGMPPDAVRDLTIDHKKHLSREIMWRAFSDQENAYRRLETVWANELAPGSTFHLKKMLTSMMRRIVGQGVATGGVWTGNFRALRHVITMRATPGAEEEIAHVFTRVGAAMVKSEPMIFGDFEETPEGFLTPKYVKV